MLIISSSATIRDSCAMLEWDRLLKMMYILLYCKAVFLKNVLLSCQVEAYPEQKQNICLFIQKCP